MKKLSVLFAAFLMAASVSASVDVVPSDADLANYYDAGQLCVCVYFQGDVCNDIVFAGTHNGWDVSNPATLPHFEEVENFEGWWVVAVTDATTEGDGICGKPVQLKKDNSFDWSYQTGDAESWTLIRGSVNIVAGYSGEADLKGYSTGAPVVMISAYWKNQGSPCVTIPTHNYKIVLDAPLCAGPGEEYYAPAIIGDFNSWSEGVAMTLNEQTLKYEYTIVNGEEGKSYKFKASTDTDWSNQIQGYDTVSGEWKDLSNSVLPVCVAADTTIEIDFSNPELYKYSKCGQEEADTVDFNVTVVVAPFCTELAAYADSVQLVGAFDGWSGTLMTKAAAADTYTITVTAVEGSKFKVKAGAGWNVEPKDADNQGLADQSFPFNETEVSLDLSAYYWNNCVPTSVENVTVNEAATRKVIENGRIYIIHNGVRYNALGAEMK